ncbi:hypothetical protein EGT74_07695 [Chitinophaga lutea]|uniref:OmpA-like domain-containing protein n=2 Tax=Chitinophaga lutea TaxID=2488634 RepID=A0A3N4PZK8_9BACT|nr:hypothetical protein EGT74_07695 [Chitinophaga lutea]
MPVNTFVLLIALTHNKICIFLFIETASCILMNLTYRHILFFIPAWLGLCSAGAQNLVANASFEDVNICTEYKAPCTPSAWESVAPEALKLDYMYHHYKEGAGNNLLRLIHVSQNPLRNYAQTRLLCPLEKGRRYRVTLLGWQDGDVPPELDLCFDTTWLFRESAVILADVVPTLRLGPGNLVKTAGKKKVFTLQQEFVAAGHYGYVAFGTMRNATAAPQVIYNYIDSIAIEPVNGDGRLCAAAARTKDSLYNQHNRHSIPRRAFVEQESQRRRLEARYLRCITLEVKDHRIFTAAGRAEHPATAVRLDSIIKAYNPGTGMKVRITGHAFREGTFNYNKVVAETNARKIMETLIYMKGFSFEDFTVDSKGNNQPRYDTTTAEGREQNNFVELEFCMPLPEEETVSAPPPSRPDTLVVPDVLFRFNSSELNTALLKELDALVQQIPKDGVQLQLVGHTDDRGEAEYNAELSKRRALAVADYLKLKGKGGSIRHVSGEGENRPVASNNTSAGRQRNRRVEIIIYKGAE